ncbi:hypothetical protein SLA2020_364360 [Shorea laevis]
MTQQYWNPKNRVFGRQHPFFISLPVGTDSCLWVGEKEAEEGGKGKGSRCMEELCFALLWVWEGKGFWRMRGTDVRASACAVGRSEWHARQSVRTTVVTWPPTCRRRER